MNDRPFPRPSSHSQQQHHQLTIYHQNTAFPIQSSSRPSNAPIRTTLNPALQSRQNNGITTQQAASTLMNALETYGPAPGAKQMLNWEQQAAQNTMKTGIYVTWRSETGNDCTR